MAQAVADAMEGVEEVDPMSMVAFDITFTDADGNELQPADGHTVSVRFEVASSSGLVTDETSALQVYHVETDEAKAPVSAEPVGQATVVEDTSADQTVEVEADSFSIYVVVPEFYATIAYEFYVANDMVAKQIVKNGESLLEPEAPVSTDEGQLFLGWYTAETEGEKFTNFNNPISIGTTAGNTTQKLYARFGTAYYVFYMDRYHRNVISTQTVAAGDTVDTSSVQLPVNVNEALVGWTTDAEGTEPQEPITATAANMTLYPVIKNAHWITYHANGGSVVEPDYVIVGDVTVAPADPKREGYTFAGWYTDEGLTKQFGFGSELESNIDLYAKWTPKTVPYQVVYWLENADDDGYTYHSSQSMEGLAGNAATYPSYIDVPEHFTLNKDKTDSETVLIDGDGTSIKNVYFARNTYTITFTTGEGKLICGKEQHTHQRYGWNSCYEWGNLICGKEEHKHTDACYEYVGESITRKYDADIKDLWELDFVKEYSEAGYLWESSKTKAYYSFLEKMPGYDLVLTAHKDGSTKYTWDYYLEALNGQAPAGQQTISVGGRTYYKFRTTVAYGWGLSLTYEEDYYDITGFTQRDKNVPDFDRNNYARLFYLRDDYDISFMENGGPDVTDRKDVLYERDISSYAPQNYEIGETTKEVNGQTWYFTGWYENEACVGQPYSFAGKTMPAHNLLLYAGWSTKTFDVTFDANGGTLADGTENYTDVHYGATVEEPDEPTLEGYLFAGWTKDDKPFSFTTPITEDTVLKAAWVPEGQGFEVIYDAGDGAGEAPVDLNRYAPEAQAEVLAPGEGLVAPDGKVFLGWMTDDGVVYQPGDLILIGREDVTLTAKWGPKPAMTKVIYHLEGGDYDAHGENAKWGTYGDENYVSAEVEVYVNDKIQAWSAPTRDGYEFLYWQRGNGKTVVASGIIQVDADNEDANILTAVWKPRNADLTITKKVDVLGDGTQSKEPTGNTSFTIHVEVNDAAYNGTYTVDGGEPQTAINGNIALTDGQTATISLPIGSAYTVTEVAGNEPGYIYFDGEESSTIEEDGNAVTITNKFFESVTTSVSGTKTWSGSGAPAATATITLYADGAVESNQPSWTDNTYTFSNLPQYKLVGEDVVEINYTVAETGVTVAGKDVSLVDGNKFVVYDKTVTATNPTQGYLYQVLGYWTSSVSGTDITNTWEPAKDQENGTYGFDVYKVDEAGKTITSDTAKFTLAKKGGTSTEHTTVDGVAQIRNLEPGTYTLTETKAPTGYVGAENSWTITVEHDGKTLVNVQKSGNVFTNIWNWLFNNNAETSGDFAWDGDHNKLTVTNEAITGTITVSKTVVDEEGKPLPTDASFTFQVKDESDRVVATLNNVKVGTSVTTDPLPYGTYTLVETEATIDDYTFQGVSYKVNGAEATSFTIDSDGEEIEVAATNTYTRQTGTLVIKKMIPAEDWSAVPDGYSGTIHYAGGQTAGEVSDSKTFGKNDFTLENGYYVKTWRIENVPTGNYTVTEDENTANITDYARTISYFNGAAAGNRVTVSANGTATVTVTNDYEIEKGTLTLEKDIYYDTVKSNAPTDKTFIFTVTIDSLPNSAVGTQTYTDTANTYTAEFGAQYKEYVFTLTGNDPTKDTATITGMPVGTRYTVTEDLTGKTGYANDLPEGGKKDTMVQKGKELTVTNTYFDSKTIDLEVEKKWSVENAYQDEVTVGLFKNDETTAFRTATLDKTNKWTASFDGLDLYDTSTSAINTYTVRETKIGDADVDTSGRVIVYGEEKVTVDDQEKTEVIGVWTPSAPVTTSESRTITITNTWTPAENTGTGSITVRKLLQGTTDIVKGATFTLTATDPNSDFEPTTSVATSTENNGTITFTDLPEGTYTLTENEPEGYKDSGSWTVTVRYEDGKEHSLVDVTEEDSNVFTNIWKWIVGTVSGGVTGNSSYKDGVLTVYNTKKTGNAYDVPDTITITKVDSENEESKLSGAKFELYKDGKKVNTADLVTVNGELTLTFGGAGFTQDEEQVTYTLKEVTPPAGYRVPAGAADTWTITVKATTEEVKEQQDGEWVFLQKTTYDATIEGDANDSDAKTIENEKVTAAVYGDDTITINKKDQYGAAVEGAVFALYDEDGVQVGADITTGPNGQIELKFSHESGDINPATDPKNAVTTTYVLKELRAPTGFADVDEDTAQWDVTVTVTPNEVLTDTDEDEKLDTWVTTYTYDATIDGADTKDIINQRNDYTVTVKKIVQAEEGETLHQGFQLDDSFAISYYDLDNVKHDLTLSTTGMTGHGTTTDPYTWTVSLPYGKTFNFSETGRDVDGYEVTTTVNGETGTSGSVVVNTTGDQEVIFVNTYGKKMNPDYDVINGTSLTIEKVGVFNGTTEALNGVEFTLKKGDQTVDTGTTVDGTVKLNINSEYLGKDITNGYDFTLIEETPEGYANDATSDNGTWTVHVGKDGEVLVSKEPNAQGFFYNIYNWIVETVTGTKGSLDVVEDAEGNPKVIITNTRQTGRLTIEKAIAGDILGDAASLEKANDQTYTFKVEAGDDTKYDVAGETIGKVTFDEDGVAYVTATVANSTTISGLPTGSYTVTEVNPDHSTVTESSYEVDYYKLVVPQAANANVTDGDTAKATITNTYNKDTGSSQATLTIRKEIKGTLNGNDTALKADQDMTYYFRISGTNVYGETVDEVKAVTVNNGSSTGEAKFTLTYSDEDGYTITEVVPKTGGGYEAINTSNSSSVAITDYTWASVGFADSDTFAFGKDGAEVTATNTYTRDTNNLSISKTVKGDTTYGAPDTASKFYEFKITANGVATVNGTYNVTGNYNATGAVANTVTFSGDGATVYMKAGETLEIADLPTGSYTVTENADSAKIDADQTDWTWTPTTALNADLETSGDSLSFTNTYTRNTGALKIEKKLIDDAGDGNPAEAGTREYTITVTAEESIRAELNGKTYTGTKTDAEEATSSVQVEFNNGVYSTTLKADEKLTIAGLPTGSYTVDEQEANISYWTWAKSITGSGEVENNQTATVTVQNDYTQKPEDAQATLTITKRVVDENGNPLAVTKDTTYTFTIGGSDIYGKDPATTTATVTVKKGETSGTTETPVSLVYGAYTVTETEPEDDDIQWYSFDETTYSDNAGSVSLNETAKSATVAVTNHYTRDNNSLTITKDVQGVETEDTRAWTAINANKFAFTVEGPAIAAEKGNNGTYTATEDDETTEQVTFTVSGNKATATVYITGEGTLTIDGLPAGEYTVTEVESSAKIPYYQAPTVTGNNGTKITVSKTSPGSATIINIYAQDPDVEEGAELTIKKEVKDNATDETITASNTYTFRITGTTVFGTEITPVQQSVSANDEETVILPKGVYQVTEINTDGEGMKIDGYTWNKDESVISTTTGIDLTEADATATATFTATNVYDRDFGSLSITKEVEGLVDTDKDAQLAIDSMEYTFKVTGPADAATRYQGEDITFTLDAGDTTASGEVIITGEDTLTLTDLPAGPYTVTEITEGKAIDLTYYNGPEVSDDNGVSKRVEQAETATQFTITNTYSPKKDDVPGDVTAKLTITKNIVDGDDKDLNVPEGESRKYYFKITGIDVYGTPVDLSVQTLEVPAGANTITTAKPIDLIYGDYAVTEVDANGKPITVDNVAGFTGYTWNETESVTATAAAIHLDDDSKTDSFTATNVYDRDLTDLTVTKIFKDISEADIERLESFKLTVAGPADFNGGAAKELKLSDSGVKKTYTQGKHVTYTWTLKDVPTGDYTVTENRKDVKLAEYSLTVKNGQGGDIITATNDQFIQQAALTKGGTASVTFQNAYKRQTGDLTIAKTVVGDKDDEYKKPAGYDTKDYRFIITTADDDVMDIGTYVTSTGSTTFAYDTETQRYTAAVSVKDGQTVTIEGLPTGTYTIAEDKIGADVEYWDLKVTGEGNVEVTNNGTAKITVTNTYTREVPPVTPPEDQPVTLTITKVVKDSRGGDLTALAAGKEYHFQITGKDVYGDAPLTQKVTITGATSTDVKLIWGKYQVIEVDASGNPINAGSAAEIDGYQWTDVAYTGDVDINLDKSTTEATVTVTNIYEPVPMDIPVIKTWSGDYSSLPNYIEVALYANGNDTGLRLTLDSGDRMDANHWLDDFESTVDQPLYRYENGGKEIIYSVVELSINGYAVNGNTLGYWTVTTGRTTAGTIGLTDYDDDATVLTVRNDYDLPDDDDDDDDDPTPSPSTEPTPSPSTEPTPSPSDEVEIPDDDTPLGDQPEEVTEDIPDDDPPLGDQPDEPDETDIFEEGTPMGNLPQTGTQGAYGAVDPTQTLGMLALSASLMAAGLMILIGRRKDEESEED